METLPNRSPVLANLLGIYDPHELRDREDEDFSKAVTDFTVGTAEDLFSPDWLRAFHAAIFGNIYAHAGAWRNESIRVAWHVPTARNSAQVAQEMARYARDCRKRLDMARENSAFIPALLGFAFWKLVYIAPFVDGNGRTACGANYLLQQSFGLPGKALYNRRNEPEYARFVNTLRAYDAGNAAPFFEYQKEKLELA